MSLFIVENGVAMRAVSGCDQCGKQAETYHCYWCKDDVCDECGMPGESDHCWKCERMYGGGPK